MTAPKPSPSKDIIDLSFDDWIPFLNEHKDKVAVRKLWEKLATMPPNRQVEVFNCGRDISRDLRESITAEHDERRAIIERYQSQAGYRAMIKERVYLFIQKRRVSANDSYRRLAEERGWNLIEGCLKWIDDENALYWEARGQLRLVRETLRNAEARLKDRFQVAEVLPLVPNGWKGRMPKFDVQSLGQVLRYLERSLLDENDVEPLNEAIGNAYCQLRCLAIPATPSMSGYPFDHADSAIAFITDRILWLREAIAEGNQSGESKETSVILTTPREATRSGNDPPQKRKKSSTKKGDGGLKLIAALTKHHEYANGGCSNFEPIGNNELARLARVSGSTSSKFLGAKFGGLKKYQRKCDDRRALVRSLMLLNGELTPRELASGSAPGEFELDDE